MKISFLATFALLAVVGAAYDADIDEELVSSENSENVRRLGSCKYDYPAKGKDGTCWKVEYCEQADGTWKKTNYWPKPKKDCYPSSSSSTSSSSSSSSSSKSKDCKDWKKKYKDCKKKNKTKKCKKKSYYKKWKKHCD
mmetsp:Transcript_20081/g.33227  ORF Transcript_20081/g.33227 Transcript_20081/m.33227 type:complete len:138 (-) Transcript_20081:487-900(-)